MPNDPHGRLPERPPLLIFIMLCLFVPRAGAQAAAPPPPATQPAPTAAQARASVDAIIKRFVDEKHPATLGMIEECIERSIAFGAPAYNAGDRAGCFAFYAKTAQSLLAAFPDPTSASEPARMALADLRSAADRAAAARGDVDRGAWSLRLAFDKSNLSVGLTFESVAALEQMGNDSFRHSHFEDATDAFQSATAGLAELEGLAPDRVPPAVRAAPLALANALFAQGKFEQASAAVLSGLGTTPEWPGVKFDLRGLHADPAEYEAILARLERAAHDAPEDAPLHFLLGYEYWFTGKRDAARLEFERTLHIDPAHPGARRFLQAAGADSTSGPRA